MGKQKDYIIPSIPQGMIELLPKEQILFNKMLQTIRSTYELFGFIPVDTPVMEKAEVLLAKSGGDTAKQVYRFFKGEHEMALRFDLTVPLARFVAQHHGELTFPFRRYHIGRAYRGESPQKGRFREFYQCDIDIIGNETLSIINDAEIPSIIYTTFQALGFENFTIRMNNRKILNGLFAHLEIQDTVEVMRIVDKIDKIGVDALKECLHEAGVTETARETLLQVITCKGSCSEIMANLETLQIDNAVFLEGLQEMREVLGHIANFGVPAQNYTVDLTIARGLDYYTGTVYETILNDYPGIGSVCSGGRYDNLAQNYTNKKLPGVGISIGLSRLFYQLTTGKIIDTEGPSTTTTLLLIPMEDSKEYALRIASAFRKEGINTEISFSDGKLSKKMSYANKLGIPYVIVIGETEQTTERFQLKNMRCGRQAEVDFYQAVARIKDMDTWKAEEAEADGNE